MESNKKAIEGRASAHCSGFLEWWKNHGSGIIPVSGADHEEHARRISELAWHEATKKTMTDTPQNADRPSAPCPPSSLTPETNAMVAADQHHLEDDNFFPATVYWRMCDLARTLERERDEVRDQRDRLAEALKMYGLGYTENDLNQLATTDSQIGEITPDQAQREIKRREALQSLTQPKKYDAKDHASFYP